jgi:adenine-specific DNA-methyltransferase
MLDKIIENTKTYISNISKEKRKKYGQFFTSKETAKYMASLFDLTDSKPTISILDPGSGTGILSCAFIDRLQSISSIEVISLTCYENDPNVLPLLKENLEHIASTSKIHVDIELIEDNYILSQNDSYNSFLGEKKEAQTFDYIIGNPPYKKIPKGALEASVVNNVCYGAPNLYFIFATMSIFNLKNDGELVYIIPRSWTSGAYFAKFREYLLSKTRIEHIHLFVSRNKVFENEDVLQETIIIKLKKTIIPKETITITSSHSNKDFDNISTLDVNTDIVVNKKNNYVFLFTSKEDIEVIDTLNKFENTLPSIGLKMKTGLVVDFRNREHLRSDYEEGSVPLLFSQNIVNGFIEFPIKKDIQYVMPVKNGFMQENKNYLIVKRFTAKEENRRFQSGIYLKSSYPSFEYISTQNKVNFITGVERELSVNAVYGLYALFNSTIYDHYYRILNGSTQVNSTEVNHMPVPSYDELEKLGSILHATESTTVKICDKVLEEYYNGKIRRSKTVLI